MNSSNIFRLDQISIVDVGGADAATIVHNVTTNEVKKLALDEGRETFITDVRGKTLGHGFLYRQSDGFRLIGSPGQSQRFAEHLDKYTIREDAVPTIRDDDFAAYAIESAVMPQITETGTPEADSATSIVAWPAHFSGVEGRFYRTRWLGEGTCVFLVRASDQPTFEHKIDERSIRIDDMPDFHHARILHGFPWYGIDLTDANLPQEADRDDLGISFTKGCYLGQETVARLDALGQVQKKLVRWSIKGSIPSPGATLASDDKTVGRLTSVTKAASTDRAPADGVAIAIGFARRSHFPVGSSAAGDGFVGTVLGES